MRKRQGKTDSGEAEREKEEKRGRPSGLFMIRAQR